MSEPFSELARARELLRSRGYLTPPPPPSRFPGWAASGLWALGLAATAALVAAGSGGGELISFLLFTLAGWPLAWAVVWAWEQASKGLARLLVGWGHKPEAVSLAVGILSGSLLLLLLAACVGASGLTAPAGAGLAAAGVFAWARGRKTHKDLRVLFHLPGRGPKGERWLFLSLLLVGVLFFVWPQQKEAKSVAAAPWKVPPPTARLAVIAVDGLSWEDVEAGSKLVGGGLEELRSWRWAPLTAEPSPFPGEFWNTVACGAPPHAHGVEVVEETRPFGVKEGVALSRVGGWLLAQPWQWLGLMQQVAKPNLRRKLPTFWEMAARAGYPVGVVGWWGTWPVRAFPGEVVSERALFSGATSADAVTPSLAPLVQEAFARGLAPALQTTLLAEGVANRFLSKGGPMLMAIAFPGLDLETRSQPSSPLALAWRQLPHVAILGRLLKNLASQEFTVFVLGAAWHGGTWFVASSAHLGGPGPPLRAEEVAPLLLQEASLPLAPYHPLPPNFWGKGASVQRQDYGSPPPVVEVPSAEAAQLQREVLRSLGYLQ